MGSPTRYWATPVRNRAARGGVLEMASRRKSHLATGAWGKEQSMKDSGIAVLSEITVSEAPACIGAAQDHVCLEASEAFVSTPLVQGLAERALTYLRVGYPVHFSGPAGTGKTTLALHVASRMGRPVTLIHGDDEFKSSDLVGDDHGYRRSKLVDNYIHSVMKTEEEVRSLWMDNRLTRACENGDILVYDEFTRSRPEANNALLSVLGEGILNLPKVRWSGEGYLQVHPGFRAIFTSNPEEYAGVHKTQDALMDRLITIRMTHYDRPTEVSITAAKSGIPEPDARVIVDIVRELRQVGVNNHLPTIRACIAIGRILAYRKARARASDAVFLGICQDVLQTNSAKVTRGGESLMAEKIEDAIRKVCGSRPEVAPRPRRAGGSNGKKR